MGHRRSPVCAGKVTTYLTNRIGIRRLLADLHHSRGIAAYGHPAGRLGATGVERLRPRENGLRSNGGERGKTDFSVGIAQFGAILKEGTARRDRAPFGLCQLGCRFQAVASEEGSAHDLNPLVLAS